MIGQEIGLDYLVPLALDVLLVDLFAEGDFYKGDLLKNVLEISTAFWDSNKVYWRQLNDLIENHRSEISELQFDTSRFDSCKQIN